MKRSTTASKSGTPPTNGARNADYETFVKLVANMRSAQQRYADEKRPKLLQKARDLEYLVDEHIKEIMQPKMFD